jgi:ketosteroid isomerase-like protein
MTTEEIANKLVEYCRKDQEMQAYKELFAKDFASVEMSEPMKEVHGMEGIQKKGEWWEENFEVHDTKVSDPLIADSHFTVRFWMDTTHKPSGQRSQMNELALYTVKNGKINREQFFYETAEE